MKGENPLRKIITSCWFLAVIPSIIMVFIAVLQGPGKKSAIQFLVFPLTYLFFVLFVYVVKRLSSGERAEDGNAGNRDHDLRLLQLHGLKAQIDPHFIFNILNTVASLIYLDDKQAAYDYLIKFTQLLRAIFRDSDLIYRSVGDELEFVTTYLDLEKLRFGDKLHYDIFVGEGISRKEMVPKLFIQAYAEDAINHGIVPLSEAGVLKIRVEKDNHYLKVTIEDNGIRKDNGGNQDKAPGNSLGLANELFSILNKTNRKPIKHKISDIFSVSGSLAGTKAEVWIPLEAGD